MFFQTLDDKNECVGVFVDGQLHFEDLPTGLTKTWKYVSYLEDQDVEYASLYCLGKDLSEVCPGYLKDDFEKTTSELKAFLVSFQESKISLEDNCFFDLVPERFLLEYCDIKNKITEHVFETYPKPANYDFLLSLAKTIDEISHRRLEINIRCLDKQLASVRTRKFIKKLSKNNKRVCYNIAGTKTGRLTTTKSSFPILTLDKKYRGVIVPKNDWLLELDFNAAELRTFLALSQVKQPDEDIHEWNIKNAFCEDIDRATAKTKAFAWLYNSKAKNAKLEKVYKREEIMNKFWDGENVNTIFNRKIEASKHHALNYIIQSTSSDLFLRRLVAVNERLKGMKSFIAFSIHDSLVVDLDEAERHVLPELVDIFQSTDLGNFKANVSVGKNFAEMRKIQ
jgi:hypothetical protein